MREDKLEILRYSEHYVEMWEGRKPNRHQKTQPRGTRMIWIQS